MPTKVITTKVRFSYAHVFVPTAIEEGQEKKYSVSIIIPKKDKKLVEKIKAAFNEALEEGKAKFGAKFTANIGSTLRDGDVDRPDDEIYENSYFLSAKSSKKPGLVDENLDPIIDQDDFYSGCFGRASINFYAFNVGINKGIAVGLNNLQKLEDGGRLSGGGASAEEDFGGDNDDDLM